MWNLIKPFEVGSTIENRILPDERKDFRKCEDDSSFTPTPHPPSFHYVLLTPPKSMPYNYIKNRTSCINSAGS